MPVTQTRSAHPGTTEGAVVRIQLHNPRPAAGPVVSCQHAQGKGTAVQLFGSGLDVDALPLASMRLPPSRLLRRPCCIGPGGSWVLAEQAGAGVCAPLGQLLIRCLHLQPLLLCCCTGVLRHRWVGMHA